MNVQDAWMLLVESAIVLNDAPIEFNTARWIKEGQEALVRALAEDFSLPLETARFSDLPFGNPLRLRSINAFSQLRAVVRPMNSFSGLRVGIPVLL